ncbi:MAG: hypothetical protein ABUT20_64470, partial [Bacteroidota bacterium]
LMLATGKVSANSDTTVISSQEDALAFLEKERAVKQSQFWPNVKATDFINNLKENILNPFSLYEGRNTNFCAYAALSYLPLHYDPLGYATFMISIYKNGKAKMGKVHFFPSYQIRQAAGTLQFKGELDIRPADQLWFLCLADHFKGYLNVLDYHFNMGDENKLWAAVNYAKFNRMIRRLFNFHIESAGSDIFRPGFYNVYAYLKKRINGGNLYLYVNNLVLYKKSHTAAKFFLPTHYVLLLDIAEADEMINITYWDYGGRTLQQVTPEFLHNIVFGITHCTKKENKKR